MGSKKIYFGNDGYPEMEILRTAEGNLFINLIPYESHSSDVWIELPIEDAKEIITELARQFGMIDESLEHGGRIIFNP